MSAVLSHELLLAVFVDLIPTFSWQVFALIAIVVSAIIVALLFFIDGINKQLAESALDHLSCRSFVKGNWQMAPGVVLRPNEQLVATPCSIRRPEDQRQPRRQTARSKHRQTRRVCDVLHVENPRQANQSTVLAYNYLSITSNSYAQDSQNSKKAQWGVAWRPPSRWFQNVCGRKTKEVVEIKEQLVNPLVLRSFSFCRRLILCISSTLNAPFPSWNNYQPQNNKSLWFT